MSHPALITLLVACLVLTACGERREPGPADETVFKEQVRALEKARSVEEELEARKRELDRQLERDVDPY
jgi:outer membrane biogenesis lipoprotein LolB